MSLFPNLTTRYRGAMRSYGMVVAITLGVSLGIPAAFAEVMGSASYRMRFDSVNVGGARGTSASYHGEDTMGEIATGQSGSAHFNLYAGYQQMDESSLSMTPGSDVTLTALSMAQNSSVGNTSWTVATDDPAGYSLSVHAGSDPALVNLGTGQSFADYTESVVGTPETWSVTSAYEFGFSGLGGDVSTGVWGSDGDCIATADVPSTTLKWRGFDGINDISLAGSAARTSPSGTVTTMCVATTQQGVFAPSGTYTATITATAVSR